MRGGKGKGNLPFNSEVSNLINSVLSSQPNCFTASITCTAAIVLCPLSPAASCALQYKNQYQKEKTSSCFFRFLERNKTYKVVK